MPQAPYTQGNPSYTQEHWDSSTTMNEPLPLLPGDVDPKKFKKVLFVYGLIGFTAITGWQLYRWQDHLSRREQAEVTEAGRRADIQRIETAERAYRAREGRAPKSLRDLVAAGDLDAIPYDPWTKRPYLCEEHPEHLRVVSLGSDGVEGGTGFAEDLFTAP